MFALIKRLFQSRQVDPVEAAPAINPMDLLLIESNAVLGKLENQNTVRYFGSASFMPFEIESSANRETVIKEAMAELNLAMRALSDPKVVRVESEVTRIPLDDSHVLTVRAHVLDEVDPVSRAQGLRAQMRAA